MNRAVKTMASILTFELFVRSVDYSTGNSYSVGYTDDNLWVPQVWGLTGFAAVAILLFGLLRNRPKVVQFGSICAFAIYTMFAVQIFEVRMLPYPWPPEDSRLCATHVAFAGLWLLSAGVIWWRSYIYKQCTDELDRRVQGG